ncbi:TPA: MarR family transcriptional regulator, partial [Streptococcus pyogenes]|nr:MarR family transcriptional regulator [Streptococcus pyogenes]
SLLVLSAIYDSKEECTQKKISQRWLVPKQTVNMILKDFEKQGLVELSPMRTDKRRKTICFTPKGKEYAKTILSKLRKVEMNAIDEMGIERMKRFNEDAALFVKLLGKAEGKNNEI